ncbi:integrase core domain-containing protein, partial [Rhodococcus rhodochrous]
FARERHATDLAGCPQPIPTTPWDLPAVASVGSKGDSYDNAMAEALNSLYKAELIFLDGPWAGREDVEAATAQWVHWFNTERVHGMLDYRTPAEVETAHYAQPPAASSA